MAAADGPGPLMGAVTGPVAGGPNLAGGDHLWQPQRTSFGSHKWSRTIRGCHNWSPRTNQGQDQLLPDRTRETGRDNSMTVFSEALLVSEFVLVEVQYDDGSKQQEKPMEVYSSADGEDSDSDGTDLVYEAKEEESTNLHVSVILGLNQPLVRPCSLVSL